MSFACGSKLYVFNDHSVLTGPIDLGSEVIICRSNWWGWGVAVTLDGMIHSLDTYGGKKVITSYELGEVLPHAIRDISPVWVNKCTMGAVVLTRSGEVKCYGIESRVDTSCVALCHCSNACLVLGGDGRLIQIDERRMRCNEYHNYLPQAHAVRMSLYINSEDGSTLSVWSGNCVSISHYNGVDNSHKSTELHKEELPIVYAQSCVESRLVHLIDGTVVCYTDSTSIHYPTYYKLVVALDSHSPLCWIGVKFDGTCDKITREGVSSYVLPHGIDVTNSSYTC